jgi:DNA repair protein RecO (recombination protein O)
MSAPARAYKARGIVLRGRNLGEADRIVTLFTIERGKIDAVAKGIRRPKSHLAGRLEFANELFLGMHRGRNLDVITSAEIARANWTNLVEPERFATANIVVELVDAFSEPDLAMDDVYALLRNALAAIATSAEPLTLLPRFSLRLLDALGLAPPTDSCIRCGRVFQGERAWLDEELGGLAGDECHVSWRHMSEISGRDLENFRAIGAPRESAGAVAVTATPAVTKAVEALVNHHLGRRPKAGLHVAEFVQGSR